MSTDTSDRLFYLFLAAVLLVIIGIAWVGASTALGLGPFAHISGSATQAPGPGPTPADCMYFAQTGESTCGSFLKYWTDHGGVVQQGLPISGEFSEVSEVDGRVYRVQYFERTELELHPENEPPNDVQPALLGTIMYKQRYPSGAPNQVADEKSGSVYFPQTGKRLGGNFLDYWRANGQLQFGYPISDEFSEKSQLDGKEYLVQYFERAAFEEHPGNTQSESILLTQLGTLQFQRRYHSGEPAPGTVGPLPASSTPTSTQVPTSLPSAVPSPTRTPIRLTFTPTASPTLFASRTPSPAASAAASATGPASLTTPVGEDTWATLEQRPVNLPTVRPGASCPASPGAQVAPGFGLALGNGPVYLLGFAGDSTYTLTDKTQEGGWIYVKVSWIARPEFVGPLLIRGHQLGGDGQLRFGYGSDPSHELRLEANTSTLSRSDSGWSEWDTYSRLRSTGCYAFQVDAPAFTEVIPFSVIDPATPGP